MYFTWQLTGQESQTNNVYAYGLASYAIIDYISNFRWGRQILSDIYLL